MRLTEHAGKDIFKAYGIPIPTSTLAENADAPLVQSYPVVLKAQVLSGDRKKHGGILIAENEVEAKEKLAFLFGREIQNEQVAKVLIEEFVPSVKEYYMSFSYSSEARGPVFALSATGGSGISEAKVTFIDITAGFDASSVEEPVRSVAEKLWKLFIDEHATLAEINPLFVKEDGTCVAGDSKIILDDEKYNPNERRYIDMDGDIAILASGGGASMLNMDALLTAGGKPANYTEYSGNPPAEVVTELTKRVLSKPGLKGCWVVGAAANFTDIHTTLSGLLKGLLEIEPKPTYPIVIRRDGPNREEAFVMLQEAGKEFGFDFHLYDSGTPMIETAKIMVELAYKKQYEHSY